MGRGKMVSVRKVTAKVQKAHNRLVDDRGNWIYRKGGEG